MSDSLDPKIMDKRIQNRLFKRGLITEKDLERHLKALPDLADQALPIESTMEATRFTAEGQHGEEE